MTAALVPPNDLESEGVVIGAVLFAAALFDELSLHLRAEDFYADANRRIWEAFAALTAAGRPLDAPSLAGWLRDHKRLDQVGGTPYIATLADAPVTVNVTEHAKRVADKARLRSIINECRLVASEAYGAVEDVDKFIQTAEARIYSVSQDRSRASRSASAREVVATCVKEIELKFRREIAPGASTGFDSLDKRIGWLRAGRVYIVAGRPGMGKTSFVYKVGKSVMTTGGDARGFFLASVEMPSDQIITRALAQEAQLDTRAVDSGFLRSDQFREICAKSAEVAEWPMILDDTAGVTVGELRSIIRRAERRLRSEYGTKLGLVAIDYAQLMGFGSVDRGASTNDKFAAVSSGVLGISKEFGVPVMLLAQLNRDCEKRPDKRPTLADLRDTGAWEQDAHSVIFLYRDDVYRKAGEPKDHKAELIVGKARGGRCGTVKVGFVDKYALFVDERNDDPEDEFTRTADELGADFDVGQDPMPRQDWWDQ